MDPTSLIALSAFLAGIGTGMLFAITPDALRGLRLIRFYLQTRDRRRAVQMFLVDEVRRRRRASTTT